MAELSSPPGPPQGFEELLRRAAVEPSGPLDAADLSRRARRIVRNRRVGTAAIVLALLVPGSIVGGGYLVPETTVGFLGGGGRGAPVTPTPGPSDRSTVAATPTAQPRVSLSASPVPLGGGDSTVPMPGSSPSASPTSPARPDRQSSATVVISDPPGSPERRPDLPGDDVHPDVMLTLVLERAEVRQGERWKGWLEARNIGDGPVALGDAECWALWGLYKDGTWVGGQRGSVCGQPHPMNRLMPDQVLRVPLEFDTVAGDDRGKGMTSLEAGRYTAATALRVTTGEHRHSGVWYAPTVTVTVREPAGE